MTPKNLQTGGLADRLRANPGVAILLTLGTIAAAAVSINAGIEASDKWIVTEAELAAHARGIHVAGEDLIRQVEQKSECRWLDDKIDRLDDLIYQLKRDGADPDRIHDKGQELQKYRDRYKDQRCAGLEY